MDLCEASMEWKTQSVQWLARSFGTYGTLPFLQLAEIQWMYFCQNCLSGCKFDSNLLYIVGMLTNIHLTQAFKHPKLSIIHLFFANFTTKFFICQKYILYIFINNKQ